MKKSVVLLILLLPFNLILVDGIVYPVLELDEEMSGVIGKVLQLKLTAFGVGRITIAVTFFELVTENSYILFYGTFDYLVNEYIYVNCSALVVDNEYEMTIECEDSMANYKSLTFPVEVDVSDPTIEFFYGDLEKMGFGDSIYINYKISDSNFAYAEVYVGHRNVKYMYSPEGTFEISYLEFELPYGYTSYLFTVELFAYDEAGNRDSRSFSVNYSDEYRAETLEERLLRNKNIVITVSCILLFYLIAFVVMFMVSRKAIAEYFYNKFQTNEATF